MYALPSAIPHLDSCLSCIRSLSVRKGNWLGAQLGLRNPVLERPWTSRDVRGAHQLRLRLYDEDAPLQLHKQRATGVPKCMGMAQCAGCGTTSYYAADGVRLTPCQNCNKVGGRSA